MAKKTSKKRLRTIPQGKRYRSAEHELGRLFSTLLGGGEASGEKTFDGIHFSSPRRLPRLDIERFRREVRMDDLDGIKELVSLMQGKGLGKK
jgi:hypothetical protein